MPIGLCISCGYICTAVTEGNSCDWDYPASNALNIYYLDLYKEREPIPKLAHGVQAGQAEFREFRNQGTIGNLGCKREEAVV